MLALFAPIKTRLAAVPALAGWGVRSIADHGDRGGSKSAEVGFAGALVGGPKQDPQISPRLSVVLVVKRSDTAAVEVDAAMAAVIESLHNWMPGTQGGRAWEPLKLDQVAPPEFPEDGTVGIVLAFSTAAIYRGQP